MALRVLLADESSTIKKVFQLALQDYAVEVKPVALGIDVHSVAADFQPDIIFADILLQKKNGYEVCAEMKTDDDLKAIPIVLMWSGFMELDKDKYEASGANGKLEKPFDVAQLRKVVQDLVPKTKTQSLSNYLEFPDLPEEEEATPPPEASQPPETSQEDSEEVEEFQTVPIPSMSAKSEKFQVPDVEDGDEGEFVMKTSTSIDVNGFQQEDENPDSVLQVESPTDHEEEEDLEDFSFHQNTQVSSVSPVSKGRGAPPSSFDLKPEEVREIVERLAPKIIEEIAWKVIPDLATQIIERELKNLLAEKESTLP